VNVTVDEAGKDRRAAEFETFCAGRRRHAAADRHDAIALDQDRARPLSRRPRTIDERVGSD
jgi:hypothetical protein